MNSAKKRSMNEVPAWAPWVEDPANTVRNRPGAEGGGGTPWDMGPRLSAIAIRCGDNEEGAGLDGIGRGGPGPPPPPNRAGWSGVPPPPVLEVFEGILQKENIAARSAAKFFWYQIEKLIVKKSESNFTAARTISTPLSHFSSSSSLVVAGSFLL